MANLKLITFGVPNCGGTNGLRVGWYMLPYQCRLYWLIHCWWIILMAVHWWVLRTNNNGCPTSSIVVFWHLPSIITFGILLAKWKVKPAIFILAYDHRLSQLLDKPKCVHRIHFCGCVLHMSECPGQSHASDKKAREGYLSEAFLSVDFFKCFGTCDSVIPWHSFAIWSKDVGRFQEIAKLMGVIPLKKDTSLQ